MGAAMILLVAMPSLAGLYVATALVGISYGGMMTSLAVICADVFGIESLGAIYSFQSLSLVIASYSCGTYLFASVYEANAAGACVVAKGDGEGESYCKALG